MTYPVLIFLEDRKPDTEILLKISDRLLYIYKCETKTMSGHFYAMVVDKKKVVQVTAFCYGIRELWDIIKVVGK